FREIVVELMVAPREPPYVSRWNCSSVKLDVRDGDDVVALTMIQEDWNARGQPLAERRLRWNVLALPAAIANEWRRDQHDRRELTRRGFRQDIEENRSSRRVAHDDGAVAKRGEFLLECRLPIDR